MLENPHPKGCPWHIYAEIFGAPEVKYCEETLCQVISEPANTWSNIPMILVGFFAYFFSRRSKNPWFGSLSLSAIAMALMSFIYHMSNNYLTQIIDNLGMYLFVGLIMILNLLKLGWITKSQVGLVYFLGCSLFCGLIYLGHVTGAPFQLLNVVLFPLMYIEFRTLPNRVWAKKRVMASALFFLIALSFQVLELNGFYCDSENHYFQLHMLWHLFNAGAIGSYLYFCYSLDPSHYNRKEEL